ncbi:hypothetical protein CC80DRAFT_587956 [Byssothecium circinans]|uniref:Uncharacterized protein n=1 Tax=Byssothecium circinans TaxID=147558 RepID=A0A6A5UF85_9PLEO|nr:hypothetical protein CC80DRAFT_587956 [Byssothecium circinans]
MDRTDSAFDKTFGLKAPQHETPHIHRSNTAPMRQKRSRKSPSNPSSNPKAKTMRPASEKRPFTQRKSTEPRRKSIASSSDYSTTKSRPRNTNSLPSSHRTSCTIVDPSRPARHYRIKSSQTVPTSTGDIDDVLALHFRSCSMFQNTSYQTGALVSPSLSEHGVGGADAITLNTTDFGTRTAQCPGTAPQVATTNEDSASLSPFSKEIGSEQNMPDTTMHWMSPSTRRHQYRKIDRENHGLRGFVKRLAPRCVSGPPSQSFYEKDKSDVGSVRRYRMDVEDAEEDEKDALKTQRRKLERSERKAGETKRWGCF